MSPYFLLAILSGLLTYSLYTAIWYLYLLGVSKTTFKRVFLANLSGTYLSFSLNAAIGTLVKVKFIGAKYSHVLAAGLLGIATEFLAGLMLITVLSGSWTAAVLALLLGMTFFADGWVYRLLRRVLEVFHRGDALDGFYSGWRASKSDPFRLALAIALGFALVISNATTLFLVGKTLGARFSFVQAIKAVLYSEFIGGAIGTPGGVGGNELGVVMAIGNGGLDVVVAFMYKLINQYSYALIGSLAFYRFVSREVGQGSYGDAPNEKGDDDENGRADLA